jgi:hypothetical protein
MRGDVGIVDPLEIGCAAADLTITAHDMVSRTPDFIGNGIGLQGHSEKFVESPIGPFIPEAQGSIVHPEELKATSLEVEADEDISDAPGGDAVERRKPALLVRSCHGHSISN